MWANVNVQERAMQVSQCCSRLCGMPVPGAVLQLRTPDRRVQDATQGEHGRENGKRGEEAQTAAGKAERKRGATDDASANLDRGDGGRGGQVGWRQGDNDTTRGRRGDGGRRAGIPTHPRGPTSPGGIRRLGTCKARHAPGQRQRRRLSVAGVMSWPCGHAIEAL